MAVRVQLHTLAFVYQKICSGEDPWIALGNFMHDFFGSHVHRRARLIQKPVMLPENSTHQQRQWAAFCAGSVEYLCQKYGLACPEWTHDPMYTLEAPWFDFDSPWSAKEYVREMLREDTPVQFARRNIFCGNRMFLNPHEHQRISLEKQPA